MRTLPAGMTAAEMRAARNRRAARARPADTGQRGRMVFILAGLAAMVLLALPFPGRQEAGEGGDIKGEGEGIGGEGIGGEGIGAGLKSRFNPPVTKVRMNNQWRNVSEEEAGRMIAGYVGKGFFSFDVSGVKAALEEHAWVEEASVKRLWPDSLSISLVEHVAIARWGRDGLLNRHGEIFQPENTAGFAALPLLDGPPGSQALVMEQYQQVSRLVFSAGLRLSGLTLSPRGSWDLVLNDAMTVTAGREQVVERLHRFISFYENQPVAWASAISSVDLRYDNGMAISNKRGEFALR